MIHITNLKKIYNPGSKNQVVALDGVNLHIKKGEIFGVIGLSGAGKSTLLRCINMLEKPTSGSIVIDGVEMTMLNEKELKRERKKIGMIFQHFNLLSSRTVYGNVAFPLEIAGKSKNKIRERVLELLNLVGLQDKIDAYPSQLSGGQKQRVGIARALANNPKVLLCDEATSALDPQTTKSILKLLKSINEKLGLTIVLITHEMQVIKEICDTVAVIESSKVIEQGPTIEIFSQPKTQTTNNFVRSVTLSDIPDEILARADGLTANGYDKKLLKIALIGETAEQPIISSMVKKFNVNANILFGNLDRIQNTTFGILVIEINGEKAEIEKALNFLSQQKLNYEVMRNGA